ncbi:NADH dehydrogenase [ubiquinone] 1 alpha subcomplex subunit 5 [Cephus cinctus]|uniref:NADH dehydrogenase [ubiquinone] 1 alpha subcomplex subunit 5 n=1 Tax=Cephus cinctus TaxID=211228 RepID=A0AAJ7BFT7_CEPCN|nr:NADH dehydrogenase [ubiquinone] 1 alpha subcomplex subunit 5 [Cephus cinctus]
MAGALKKTTGLTGLAVSIQPHYFLSVLYSKVLRALEKLPQDYIYRQQTEEIIRERAAILKNNPDWRDVEAKIGCGQMEELMIQAENELRLAKNMVQWKPWEQPEMQEPPNQWKWPPHN